MIDPRIQAALERAVNDIEVTIEASGFKSSEGDGRTSADIERERAEAQEGTIE